jgi:hypothetical protein
VESECAAILDPAALTLLDNVLARLKREMRDTEKAAHFTALKAR